MVAGGKRYSVSSSQGDVAELPRWQREASVKGPAAFLARLLGMAPQQKAARPDRGSYSLIGANPAEGRRRSLVEEDESERSGDDGQEEEKEEYEVDIPEDAYGAAILSIVRDLPIVGTTEGGGLAVVSCLFGIGVLLMNLVLQFSILIYIREYVVKPDIKKVQKDFGNFRNEVFLEDGTLSEVLWQSYLYKDDLCAIAMWNRPFYYAVLFCWSLGVTNEIRRSNQLFHDIWQMPACRRYEEQFLRDRETPFITGLTSVTRTILIWVVCIPKLLLAFFLLWLGCEWLSATIHFESLVSNTVAMNFVVNIDELLYGGLIPQVHRKDVEEVNFLVWKSPLDEATRRQDKLQSFCWSIGAMLLIFSYVIVYAELVQDVLPTSVFEINSLCKNELFEGPPPKAFGVSTLWARLTGGIVPTLDHHEADI